MINGTEVMAYDLSAFFQINLLSTGLFWGFPPGIFPTQIQKLPIPTCRGVHTKVWYHFTGNPLKLHKALLKLIKMVLYVVCVIINGKKERRFLIFFFIN